MYKITDIFYSICRHKRRNMISCLLLIAVMAVTYCGFFYREYAQGEIANVTDRYIDRCYISFRNELQYNPEYPHHSALDIRLNGTSVTDGNPDIFFDENVMEAYNHPYPAVLEMFQTLGKSEFCEDYEVAYAETAYGFADTLPAWMEQNLNNFYSAFGETDASVPDRIFTEHIVVGGSLDAFTGIARNATSGYLYDFILQEGSGEPGPGECVITDFYADIYQKNIGDRITLYDVYRNPIATLTVSGIYSVYATENYEFVNPQIPRSGRKITGSDITRDYKGSPDIGTPFDRLGEDLETKAYSQEQYFGKYFRIENAMISLIHTDLETAYNLYGTSETDLTYEERHHFNNFFVFYDLRNAEDVTAFEAEMKTVFPVYYGEEFTVYTFENSYRTFIRIPENLLDAANTLVGIAGVLTGLLMFIISMVLVYENGKEIGIYLSMGISETDIFRKTASENAVLNAAAGILAIFCGKYVHSVLVKGYTYLEMRGAEYSPQWSGIVFAGIAIMLNFVCTAVITYLYIRVNSPVKLIRQE